MAQTLCRRLPPCVSQRLRNLIYPYEVAFRDDYHFVTRAITGSLCCGTTRDMHAYPLSVHGFYEWRNLAIALTTVSAGDIILEIGANVGTETIGFSDLVGPGGKVYAFEPLPLNVRALRALAGMSRHNNILVETIALSDRAGSLQFTVPPEDRSGTGHILQAGEEGSPETVEVECMTLDAYAARGIPHCKMVFIDTEGEEVRILRGARSFLGRCQPFLVVEASSRNLQRCGFGIRDLYTEMTSLGYHPYAVGRFGLLRVEGPQEQECNWLGLYGDDPELARRLSRRLCRCFLAPCVSGLNPLVRS